MNSKTEKRLIRIIREEYKKRLASVLMESVVSEIDVMDKRGNMLLSPGLKVRHRDSGYEYTVEKVEGEGSSMKIYLRNPDQPRFDPPDSKSDLMEFDANSIDYGRAMGKKPSGTISDMIGGKPPQAKSPEKVELEKDTDNGLVITKQEFEKDYEVD